jgi:hypothetical protein
MIGAPPRAHWDTQRRGTGKGCIFKLTAIQELLLNPLDLRLPLHQSLWNLHAPYCPIDSILDICFDCAEVSANLL